MTGRQRGGKFESKLEKRLCFANQKTQELAKHLIRNQELTNTCQ